MSEHDFDPIANSLRDHVTEFFERAGENLTDSARLNTLETNSELVAQRAEVLLLILAQRGIGSLAGLRIVDLGCGFGALSVFFAARGAIVTAIDPKADRLAVGESVAAEYGLPVTFRKGRMQSLDLPDRSFDLAVQNNSFCYVVDRDDRGAVLAETLRVLRPGGVVVIRNPNRWSLIDQFTGIPLVQLLPPSQAHRSAVLLGRKRSQVRVTSPPEAVRELRKAGFANVAHVASPTSRWPGFTKTVAGFQHVVGERPHPWSG